MNVEGRSIYLIACGAGAGVQRTLWATPGASAYLVGAEFPYARAVTDKALGFAPESYVSRETALDLAFSAYRKACLGEGSPVGLAVTAAVATNRVRKGESVAHAVCITRECIGIRTEHLVKGDGALARAMDGAQVDQLVEDLLEDTLDGVRADHQPLARTHFMKRPIFSGTYRYPSACPGTLYPGAFNPPHRGHYHAADSVDHEDVVFAICSNPPHKPRLTVQEMLERSAMFRETDTVMFTEDDPLYIDKARRYPGARIILGSDAAQRLFDPKWGVEPMEALGEFDRLGTGFDLFTRVGHEDVVVPPEYERLFKRRAGYPEAISSTQLRTA